MRLKKPEDHVFTLAFMKRAPDKVDGPLEAPAGGLSRQPQRR